MFSISEVLALETMDLQLEKNIFSIFPFLYIIQSYIHLWDAFLVGCSHCCCRSMDLEQHHQVLNYLSSDFLARLNLVPGLFSSDQLKIKIQKYLMK